jgi:PPE-repeat protein
MSFMTLPPEVNSWLMFSGAGSGPMLAAAAAWDGLASELESAADSFSSVTSGLASQAWQGPASQAMAAAATPYAGWLSAAATQASGAAAQAQAVASEFESAFAATVHPVAVSANRSDLVSLVMSNLFGQNAPAIAATEGQYEEMWAQDVAAMVGYHGGASAAAAQLAAPAQALQNLPAMAANAAANAASNAGIGLNGNNQIGIGPLAFTPSPTSGSAQALPTPAANVIPVPNFGINAGFANLGTDNVGFFNTGNFNFGIGNAGFANTGIANLSPINGFVGNLGLFNNGIGNLGIGNFGLANSGLFNTGTANSGLFNNGSFNFGIGLTGNDQIGIGLLTISRS